MAISSEFYKAGETVFREDQIEFDFYIVQSGLIEISKIDSVGKSVVLARLGEGESFGEFAYLDQTPRSATARAIEDSVVVRVERADYDKLLQELPVWARSLFKNFVERLKTANDKSLHKS